MASEVGSNNPWQLSTCCQLLPTLSSPLKKNIIILVSLCVYVCTSMFATHVSGIAPGQKPQGSGCFHRSLASVQSLNHYTSHSKSYNKSYFPFSFLLSNMYEYTPICMIHMLFVCILSYIYGPYVICMYIFLYAWFILYLYVCFQG